MENRKPESIKLTKIADLVGGNLIGNGNTMITGVAGLKDATRNQISFLANLKYISSIESSDAAALIIPKDIDVEFRPVIKVDNPYLACIGVINLFNGATHLPPDGIHPNAEISRTARIGGDCHISTFVVIEDDVVIGERCYIFPGVFIGKGTVLGDDCIIYPNVTIREKITIGSRVIVHSGTVLGSDGFGYAHDKGLIKKIPQVGTVIIEDDVEIGANVCVDRATFGKTHIKNGTKIDNLVQIAHNVVIGNNATVVAQVGISGSTEIGDGVTLAGQSGIAGHLKVGPHTVVAAKSGVTKDIPGGLCVSGFPAQDHKKEKRLQAHIHTLPQLRSKVIKQEERIENLENQIKVLMAELQRSKSTE